MADFTTDTDQQQVPQPPVKLKVNEFAAKIKSKYPEYKDVADDVLVDKIIAKYPQYKTQVDIPVKKNESQPTPSNVSDGQSPVQETSKETPQVVPQVVEKPFDPIQASIDATVFGNATKIETREKKANEFDIGNTSSTYEDVRVPDEDKIKQGKDIEAEMDKQGFKANFREGMKDFPQVALNHPSTSKEVLIDTYKNNPIQFQRLTNEAKIKYSVRQAVFQDALDNLPDTEDKRYIAEQTANIIGNKYSGDDRVVNNMQDVYSMIQDKQDLINKTISDPQQKEKLQGLLKQTYASYINPETADFKDEYSQSGLQDKLDINQYAGLQTLKLFDPEKYKNYLNVLNTPIVTKYFIPAINTSRDDVETMNTTDSAFASKNNGKVSDQTISQKIGQQKVLSELNNIGINNTAEQVISKQHDLESAYKNASTPEEQNAIVDEFNNTKNKLSQLQAQQNMDDSRYPELAAIKFDTQTKEALQDRGDNLLSREANRFGHSWSSTVDAADNVITSLFGSDKDKAERFMQVAGEGEKYRLSTYLPESERKTNSPYLLQVSDDLKGKLKSVLDGKSLSDASPEQLTKMRQLVADNQSQIKTVTNPIAGKTKNFFSKATLIESADFATDVSAFMSQVGIGKEIGVGVKAAEAATLFKDGYTGSFDRSIEEGKSVDDAHSLAMLDGSASALMAAIGSSKYEDMKSALSGGKSKISKQLLGLSEQAWNDIAKKNKSLVSRLGSSLKNSAIETGKNALKFGGVAPILHDVARNVFNNENKSASDIIGDAAHSTVDMLRGSLGFAAIGTMTGAMKYKASPLEKSAVWDLGDNPEINKAKIDELVSKGELTPDDGKARKKAIDNISVLINKVPTENDKGKKMTDDDRQNYLYNLTIQNKANELVKELPEKQAEKHDIEAQAAMHRNAIMLAAPTEIQLEKRKAQLEKSLIPETKEDGTKVEIPQKEIVAAKAEMQAIDDILADHKKANEAGVVIEAPTKINEPIQIGTNAGIEKANENGVAVQQPMNVPEAITPKETTLTKEEQDAVDVISKSDFNTEDGKRVKIWTDIISDPNATIENKKQALKELGEQLADKNSETETGLALGKSADAIYTLNDANGVKVEPLKIEVNEEPQVEVPIPPTESGVTDEGVNKESGAAKEGYGSEEWSSVRKAKLKEEISGVKEIFEKRVPKGWKQVYSSALESLGKMYPKKSLYDAMKTRVNEFVAKVNNRELFNPTSEDIAVFNLFKAETQKRIGSIEGMDSDNSIVRQAALAEFNPLHEDLINVARVTNPNGEAGRAFGLLQSEINTNDGLKIRRMELMKAKGGEKLTPEEEKWTSDKWEQEKELMKQEEAIRSKAMQEDFDNKISELKKEYEEKLKSANSKVSKTTKEKTLSQKGKEVADKIRKLKKPKSSTNIDFTLGTWDLAVEGIAKLVEGGATVSEAIAKMVKDGIIAFKEDKDKDDFEDYFAASLGERMTKEDALSKIADFAKENDVTDITNEMVGQNLIRDYVESHIGEVDQAELLDTAAKDLKSVLPNVDRKTLIEAYLKKNEFKQPTKKDVEGGLVEAKKQLKSIAKLTEDIEDLNGLKEVRQRTFPTERAKSEAEQQLFKEKEAKIKEITNRNNQIKNDNAKLASERDRQLKKVSEFQNKKDKLLQGIKEKTQARQQKLDIPEIEGLKNEVKGIEKAIREAEAAQRAAERKIVSDRNKQIKRDNSKIESEAIRQVKRVQDLQDKKEKLENGIREKRSVLPKVDTPEIESLKEQVKEADKNLREAEVLAKKMSKDIQDKKDKIDELNANIERAKNDRDLIKTHKNKSESEIDEEIAAKQKELKKAVKDNSSEERVQAKKLAQEKENTIKKIKEFQQKLADGDFEEPIPVKLKKQDAELIRLKKQQSIIEEAYRKKQHEVHEKNKTGLERAADFARSMYVAILIGAPKTLLKVGSMSLMRPLSEVATKATLGKVFNAFFPNMSKAALRGGESSSIRSIQKGAEAYFRQMGDKKMEALYEKANNEYDAATEAYNKYKNSGNLDSKKLEHLKNNMNNKLIKVQGSFIYKFIGGSSIKDVMKALVNRSNEIEKQFGKVEGESIKDGNWLDKINYVMGFIGRSHSALKTFSGRFSFAAGFMARLEGAVKNGEDISNPDKVLEIAHESYLDWERGKYQQSNQISDLWNKLTNHISEGEVGTPREGASKIMAALLRTEVAITRVPVNILHEAVMEYTLGAFKAAILANREVSKIKGQLKTEGLMPNEPEFKAALKERISQMDETQAATIARCFRKGGLGVGLYALALITGAMHFGIFPHMGQKKKKDEEDLGVDELNPGQVMLGDNKFGEVTSGVIEHIPALWTTFMGVGMAQAYNDEIKKGKTTKEAVAKSIYTHLKIVEGGIPQSKIISPTRVAETIYQSVKKKMTDAGILDKVESKGGKHSKNTKR